MKTTNAIGVFVMGIIIVGIIGTVFVGGAYLTEGRIAGESALGVFLFMIIPGIIFSFAIGPKYDDEASTEVSEFKENEEDG